MGSFDGQTVLITGGGTGLGRGLIDSFVDEGAKVGVLEVAEDKVEKLRADLDPKDVVVVAGDVRSLEDNQRSVAETVDAFGGLDAFIHCAGITDWTPAFTLIPDDKMSEAFDEVMRINVLGPILGAKAAVPELRKSHGSMVFTLSTSGFFPGGQGAIYTISKHALEGVVRQLAYELAPTVRVNGVVPGAIQESRIGGPEVLGQQDLYPEKAFPGMAEMITKVTPLQLYASAADYAPIYLLLADRERARAASGSIVFWDTGISIVGHGTAVMEALQSGAIAGA
jgi:NAD(P)-dependent dehydrogenase (short-subunit alcohol dehydrogenase family)